MTGTAHVIHGDSRHLPLADNSVDLVVTSPPYFALRSYTDNGIHYERQIGAEATPDEFVTSLLEVTRECVRVLNKSTGSLWVNLGDKYAGSAPGSLGVTGSKTAYARDGYRSSTGMGVPTKSLMGIPWRYALRCIDELGLILRAEVIWAKPNGLPESVTDRVRRSHEQWFHFTLSPRYFSAVDEIREDYAPETTARYTYGFKPASAVAAGQSANGPTRADGGGPSSTNPLGKLPGSVWTIPTEPLNVPDHLGVDHFAAFPTEWPRRIIAGWSPAGVCTVCGVGRRPVTQAESFTAKPFAAAQQDSGRSWHGGDPEARSLGVAAGERNRTITGYACACPEPTADTTPAVVLDPFGGTGTTALVAKALGRHGITVDMSSDYCRLARWRVNDPGELAKAARVEKPPKQVDGQGSLLDLFEEESA